LAKLSIPVLPQPLYLTDLSLPRLFPVPKIEMTLKGRRFQMVQDIITSMTDELKVIQETSFELCFRN
jgi:hypothetical protein